MNKKYIILQLSLLSSIASTITQESGANIVQTSLYEDSSSFGDELAVCDTVCEELCTEYDTYDQEVCDYVQPPMVSNLTVKLRNVGISLLIKCITIKQYLHYCWEQGEQKLYSLCKMLSFDC